MALIFNLRCGPVLKVTDDKQALKINFQEMKKNYIKMHLVLAIDSK